MKINESVKGYNEKSPIWGYFVCLFQDTGAFASNPVEKVHRLVNLF